MYYKTTVTQKGQITIPKPLRDWLRLRPASRVVLAQDRRKKNIIVSQAPDILELAGTYRAPRGKSSLAARGRLEKDYRRT